MALIVCPLCVREDDIYLLRTLPDGRKEAECKDCNFTFVYGAPTPEPKPAAVRKSAPRKAAAKPKARTIAARPIEYVVRQFPTAADVAPDALEPAEALKAEFLTQAYEPDPLVTSHWTKYRWVFTAEGLEKVAISDLKQFADDPIGVSTGDPTEFDKAWVLLGELEGARRVRAVTNHLLRGHGAIEDRLTDLIGGSVVVGMPGWGEALLTKTLSVADPDRFLPVVTYAEKRAIAAAVHGLELPDPDETSWTIGRLGVWTNDLLVDLAGDGFADLRHVATYVRWAAGR